MAIRGRKYGQEEEISAQIPLAFGSPHRRERLEGENGRICFLERIV